MKKVLQKLRELRGVPSLGSAVSLKKKTTVCSTEAAAVSIAIHVLFAVFAGSWVAIKYVQKREAAFSSENIARPKLERRQLQMPVKVQNLQKKSQRPRVTSRMASVSKSSFALPDMSGLGGLGGSGLGGAGQARDGASAKRLELSSMGASGSLGFGIAGINFFGARSNGEKLAFIIDASKSMMVDEKGGYNTYKYAKDKVYAMINRLSSATLFNVMLYADQVGGKNAVMFRTQMVPATPENCEALKKWLEPLNADPKNTGKLDGFETSYISQIKYDTVIGGEAASWVKPVQAALEQGADNIFVLCAGWGDHIFGPEYQKKIGVDPAKEAEWLKSKGWSPERVAAADKVLAEFYGKVDQILAAENRQREEKNLPPKIMDNAARWKYITEELKLTPPESRPYFTVYAFMDRSRYDFNEIIEHLRIVYEVNYIPKNLSKPQLHFVRLIAENDTASGSDDGTIWLKKVATAFRGNYNFLRGAKTVENLMKYNEAKNENLFKSNDAKAE